MGTLDINTLSVLFGTETSRLEKAAGKLISSLDLGYRDLVGAERDKLILTALTRIHSAATTNAGEHRLGDWEIGWQQNLDDYIESGFDPKKLVPKYVKPNVPVKLNREYVLPNEPNFVYWYTQIFRAWLFREFFSDYKAVHEFGCGTGHNLVHMAELYPDKELHGYDWARSSQEIIRIIVEKTGINITGGRFDFFEPDHNITVSSDHAVLTFGALEQIGNKHEKYIKFLLEKRPGLCVDVIGIHEFYDETNLVDYLSLLYHKRRNYLDGYMTRLRELEASGEIKILKTHHHLFGNPSDDPYSYIAWKII